MKKREQSLLNKRLFFVISLYMVVLLVTVVSITTIYGEDVMILAPTNPVVDDVNDTFGRTWVQGFEQINKYEQVSISKVIPNGSIYTIGGKIKSGSEKQVTILIIKRNSQSPNSSGIFMVTQVKSKVNGDFKLEFIMPDKDRNNLSTTGDYTIYAGGEEGETSHGFNFHYTSYVDRIAVIKRINNVEGTPEQKLAAIKAILLSSECIDALKAITELYNDFYSGNNLIQNNLCQILYAALPFDEIDETDFKDESNKAIALSSINDAKKDNIEETLTRYQDIFNLKYNDAITYQTLINNNDANDLSWICERLLEEKKFENVDDLESAFKNEYALYLVNTAHYTILSDVLKENKVLLTLESNTDYLYYAGLSDKLAINSYLALSCYNNPAKTVSQFLQLFSNAVQDYKNKQNNNVPSGGGGKSSSGGGGQIVTVSSPITVPADNIAFTDLDCVPWAVNSIRELATKGVVTGYNGEFRPTDKVTREQFTKMIIIGFRMLEPNAKCDFTDVSEGAWYYPYIASAKARKIINGLSDGNFGVGNEITREEMAAMSYRTAMLAGVQLLSKNTVVDFSDKENISSYAFESIIGMQKAGIINGVGNNKFAPKDFSTRAEAAKIICELTSCLKK